MSPMSWSGSNFHQIQIWTNSLTSIWHSSYELLFKALYWTCRPLQSRWLTPKVEVGNLQWLAVHWSNLRGVNSATLSCKAMFICSSKERIVQHTARVSTATQAAADGIGRCILRLSRKYAENCWALGLGGFPAPMFFSSWTLIGHFYIPLFWYTELDPWLEFLSNTNWLLADIYK